MAEEPNPGDSREAVDSYKHIADILCRISGTGNWPGGTMDGLSVEDAQAEELYLAIRNLEPHINRPSPLFVGLKKVLDVYLDLALNLERGAFLHRCSQGRLYRHVQGMDSLNARQELDRLIQAAGTRKEEDVSQRARRAAGEEPSAEREAPTTKDRPAEPATNEVTRQGESFWLNGQPLQLGTEAEEFLLQVFRPGQTGVYEPGGTIDNRTHQLLRRIRVALRAGLRHPEASKLSSRMLRTRAGKVYFNPCPPRTSENATGQA